MSSPFPGLNVTRSTGQTGLNASAKAAGADAVPARISAAATALLDETMPFMSLSLKKFFVAGQLGCRARRSGRLKTRERASSFYAAASSARQKKLEFATRQSVCTLPRENGLVIGRTRKKILRVASSLHGVRK